MRSLKFGSLLAGTATAAAFQDTSPFFLFSTAELSQQQPPLPQLVKSSTLLESVTSQLSPCDVGSYIIIHQPGADATDFADASTSPTLRRYLDASNTASNIKSSYSVAEVVGQLDPAEIQDFLAEQCKADITQLDGPTGHFEMAVDLNSKVMRFDYPTLPASKAERISQLKHIDNFLASLLDYLPASSKHTVMYITTSGPATESQVFHHTTSHEEQKKMELKRRSSNLQARQGNNVTLVDGPLFDRYQFFTPGLFMGLIVGLVLLSILGVGMNAVSSLKVTYAAFDKDMGPAAQKKQQ